MKNIGLLNENGTCFGIGASLEEAERDAVDAGIDSDEVGELIQVELTSDSVREIQAGNPDAVEINQKMYDLPEDVIDRCDGELYELVQQAGHPSVRVVINNWNAWNWSLEHFKSELRNDINQLENQ